VFLTDATPADPAPTSLNFTNNGTVGDIATSFTTLSPLLNQQFFIGDGLTGNGSGATQQFIVPNGATRFFLGFEDAGGYSGAPGQYQDNSGTLQASFTISGSAAAPEPAVIALLAPGLALLLPRRRG